MVREGMHECRMNTDTKPHPRPNFCLRSPAHPCFRGEPRPDSLQSLQMAAQVSQGLTNTALQNNSVDFHLGPAASGFYWPWKWRRELAKRHWWLEPMWTWGGGERDRRDETRMCRIWGAQSYSIEGGPVPPGTRTPWTMPLPGLTSFSTCPSAPNPWAPPLCGYSFYSPQHSILMGSFCVCSYLVWVSSRAREDSCHLFYLQCPI
jgi:hypothetical protein